MMRCLCLVLLVPLAAGGCANRAFDQHMAAGRGAEAATAFREDSSLHGNERRLFRAALVHAAPDRGAYEPQRARDLLVRLLDEHPHSVHRESAIGMIALIDEVGKVRSAGIAREQQREAERARLHADIVRLESELGSARSRLAAQDEDNFMLRGTVDRLQAILRDREAQLAVLRTELDRLKAIDLRSTSRPGPSTDAGGGSPAGGMRDR
jgi:hypothetical protein